MTSLTAWIRTASMFLVLAVSAALASTAAQASDQPTRVDSSAAASAPDVRRSDGVTATSITIGLHAPLTGAAPLPAQSFTDGKDQYWRSGRRVAGRRVHVELRDDQSNPSSAAQVCQELIEREEVFVLVGFGGPDEIAECARTAAAAGVPYLSPGTTQTRLGDLPRYFSVSKSYRRQMPLLLQFINAEVRPSNDRVGLVASNTANYDDAVAAFTKAAENRGLTAFVYRPSKQASDGELAGVAQKMVSDQVTVATPLITPVQWIKLAANPQLRTTRWHGVGMTMGLNTVATAACQSSGSSVDGSTFFSPWPGRNLADDLAPGFINAGGGDDIKWALWGLNKTLHAGFKNMGENFTRRAFRRAMLEPVRSGIYPNLNHTRPNHFRARQVHQLRLDCDDQRFKSTRSMIFRTGF